MIERVDLTEDSVFQDNGIHFYSSDQTPDKKSQPVICWLGDAQKNPNFLRARSKEFQKFEALIVPKEEPKKVTKWSDPDFSADYDGDTIYYRVNTRSTLNRLNIGGTPNTLNTNLSTIPISWTIGNTVFGSSNQYSFNSTNTYTITTKYSPTTVKYTGNYLMDSTGGEIRKDTSLEDLRLELWGCRYLPITEKDIFQMSSKDIRQPLPWKPTDINLEDSYVSKKIPQLFPWFPKPYSSYGEEETALQRYANQIRRYNESLHFIKGNPAAIFAGIGKDESWFHRIYEEEETSDISLPWRHGEEFEQGITDDNRILSPSEIHIEKETYSDITESIRTCLPWMIDMIRDVWRETISMHLIEDYFKDQWHFITIPELREKWYEGKQLDITIDNSVQGTFTINSNAISTSDIRVNDAQITRIDVNSLIPTYSTFTTTNRVAPLSITDWTVV